MTRRSKQHTRVAGVVAAALVLAGCWGGGDDDDTASTSTSVPTVVPDDEPIVTVDGVPIDESAAGRVLGIRLSEGAALVAGVERVPIAAGIDLTEAEVAAILARLPAWNVPPVDRAVFNRPATTLLPPVVGDTIEQAFPPDGDATAPDTTPEGPLEVVRFQPEGPVDLAPFVTATFSEPMVPITTLDQLDAADVPMTISPAIDGRWRWIGTRTLRFELVPGELDRLPASTEYTVEIPAGTTSANGATLREPVRWNFTTPTPTVTAMAGVSDSMPTRPVWVLTFDQRVDADDVLAAIVVTADGTPVTLRVATPAEVDDDDGARQAVEAALDQRSVAFTPASALPVDAAIGITVGPNVPSAEGPLTGATIDRYSGHTYGALRVAESSCGYGGPCTPGTAFVTRFTNQLDTAAFRSDLVSVEPAIRGLRINVYGDTIEVAGSTRGRTTYRVTFDGDLTDSFGQRLGDDVTVSFDVGPADPALNGLQRDFITTDPGAAEPTVSISTINHDAVRVRAWAVTPAELGEFRDYVERMQRDLDAEAPEWTSVLDAEQPTAGRADEWTETRIDLSDAFAASSGQLVVRVDPIEDYRNSDLQWQNQPSIAWVQQTTLALDAILDSDTLVISTNDLLTGEPVGGVPVELLGDGRVATTDQEGLAQLQLGDAKVTGLFANAGDRTALLTSDWWEGWTRQDDQGTESRWFVFDDRGVYRPGETAHLTGWVRRFDWSGETKLELYDDGVATTYAVRDGQGAELATGTLELSALGRFTLDVDVPAGANQGQAWIDFQLTGAGGATSYTHTFQIQEFRRPEFEVNARAESPAPYYRAEPATVAVDAEYFAGGPLPDAEVSWLVSTSDTSYTPPNWSEFTFGIWQPWWWFGGGGFADIAAEGPARCFDCGPGFGTTDYETFAGRTDAGGTHYLRIDFEGDDVDLPKSVTAEATVFDVNRQAWASRTTLLVHPAQEYVGLRTDRNFVREGTPIRVDAVVPDVDGNLVAGRSVEVVAGRLEWTNQDGTWSEQVVDPQTCTFVSTDNADDGSMRCEFSTDVGGTYRVTATVTDENGQKNRSEITQWVTGGQASPVRNVEQEQVTIVPDRESYAPGDTAELLVQAPFAPAYGTVTIIHHDIVSTEAFEAEDGSAVVEVPILDGHVPNLTVRVDMNGSSVRTDDNGVARDDLPSRPAYATGQIDLPVPPVTRTLDVEVTPADAALEPGDETSVTVRVTDAAGDAVDGADVALVVVDEAVLSLTGYQLADPIEAFYQTVWPAAQARLLRSTVLLTSVDQFGRDEDTASGESADAAEEPAAEEPAADGAPAPSAGATSRLAAEPGSDPIVLRSDFDPVAVYAPTEVTGPDGTVTVAVPLPDNLTRYRVMAVAVDGVEHFGKGESTITARLPLMVRASAPRFLNFGDRFELPVVLQNQTDEPLDVDLAVEVANLQLSGTAGRRVTVPANDRVEVRFPATTVDAGTARARVAAVSGSFSDAAEFSLPVYTPSTKEAFATYGVVDGEPIGQPVSAPDGVIPQFGGLEIDTSSTALQALTDAVLYLVDYRWDSSDGYASRLMAIAALRDVLDAFEAEGLPSEAELNTRVGADIEALVALQNDDGGFPYWQRGRESIPWNSVQAAHALVLARDAGYAVPADAVDRALAFVADIESHIPADYSEQVRNSIRAYAIHVLDAAGRRDTQAATSLFEEVGDELELDALAWIWPSIDDPELLALIQRRFENSAVETAGAATFATGYGEDAYVIAQSDRRVDGVVLDALVSELPDSDLVPKVVNGLLGQQRRGHWNNAQENSFILLALHRYFTTFEAIDPAFVARAWLGDTYVTEAPFLDRTTDRAATVIPMADLLELTTPPADATDTTDPLLVVAKDGDGRLYYRIGLTYAPSDLALDARDEGFVVERSYEPVGDASTVSRDPDGTWHVTAGATVRVRVTMVADARRTHVALSDPLPAGLEPINPELTVSQTFEPEQTDEPVPSLWWWRWFDHQNLRDDRAEAFATYLEGGTYEYTYLARATTPGTFVVPPTTAEEIYAPEVFGRSSTDRLVVE